MMRKDFEYQYHLNIEKWQKMQKFFMFPWIDSVRIGLITYLSLTTLIVLKRIRFTFFMKAATDWAVSSTSDGMWEGAASLSDVSLVSERACVKSDTSWSASERTNFASVRMSFNSLWPSYSNTIQQYISGATLALVMACCTAVSK